MSRYGVCLGPRGSSRKPAEIIEGVLFFLFFVAIMPPILTWAFTVLPYMARIIPGLIPPHFIHLAM